MEQIQLHSNIDQIIAFTPPNVDAYYVARLKDNTHVEISRKRYDLVEESSEETSSAYIKRLSLDNT